MLSLRLNFKMRLTIILFFVFFTTITASAIFPHGYGVGIKNPLGRADTAEVETYHHGPYGGGSFSGRGIGGLSSKYEITSRTGGKFPHGYKLGVESFPHKPAAVNIEVYRKGPNGEGSFSGSGTGPLSNKYKLISKTEGEQRHGYTLGVENLPNRPPLVDIEVYRQGPKGEGSFSGSGTGPLSNKYKVVSKSEGEQRHGYTLGVERSPNRPLLANIEVYHEGPNGGGSFSGSGKGPSNIEYESISRTEGIQRHGYTLSEKRLPNKQLFGSVEVYHQGPFGGGSFSRSGFDKSYQ